MIRTLILAALAIASAPSWAAFTQSQGLVVSGTADNRPVLCRPAQPVVLTMSGGVLTLDADCGGVAQLHCQPTTFAQTATYSLTTDCKTITAATPFKVAHLPAMTTISPNNTAPLLVQVYNNTGKILTSLTATPSGAPACATTRSNVAAGAVVSYSCNSPSLTADLVDTVTVQATATDGTTFRAAAKAIVMVDTARLGIAVQPRYQVAKANAPVSWTVWVRNMGPTAQTSLIVADQRGDANCSGTLDTFTGASLIRYPCGIPAISQSFTDLFSASAYGPATLVSDTRVQVVTSNEDLYHGDFEL